MRRTLAAAAAMCALLVLIADAGRAAAATVTVLGRDGHARVINNPYIDAALSLPPPASAPATSVITPAPLTIGGPLAMVARAPHAAATATTPGTTTAATTPTGTTTTGGAITGTTTTGATGTTTTGTTGTTTTGTTTTGTGTTTTGGGTTATGGGSTVPKTLQQLEQSGLISAADHRTYLGQWNSALNEEKQLSSARAAQLADVTVLLHNMAAAHEMTATRLPVLFLTLQRNAQYWKSGAMLSYGARVQFPGSEIEWEYYPGQGIQLQVLGTFGEADGYYESGKAGYPKLVTLMQEMLPLAVKRGGGLTWEYYFDWEGGTPPWVSAMAQGTGLEALSNAYLATGNQMYLTTAHQMLPLLETKPATGGACAPRSGAATCSTRSSRARTSSTPSCRR